MGVAPIKMPQLGESVTEGTVDRWLKKEGDYVRRDEPIVEVVTDKVNAEIPAPAASAGVGEVGGAPGNEGLASGERQGPAPHREPEAAAARPRPAPPPRPSPAAAARDGEELVRLSAMRRSIAEHMTRSLATS